MMRDARRLRRSRRRTSCSRSRTRRYGLSSRPTFPITMTRDQSVPSGCPSCLRAERDLKWLLKRLGRGPTGFLIKRFRGYRRAGGAISRSEWIVTMTGGTIVYAGTVPAPIRQGPCLPSGRCCPPSSTRSWQLPSVSSCWSPAHFRSTRCVAEIGISPWRCCWPMRIWNAFLPLLVHVCCAISGQGT